MRDGHSRTRHSYAGCVHRTDARLNADQRIPACAKPGTDLTAYARTVPNPDIPTCADSNRYARSYQHTYSHSFANTNQYHY